LLKPVPGERFTVKATNSSIGSYDIPGYFFKGDADPLKKLPTFIMVSGYDGSQQESYHALCEEVLRRGMNCVTYEGPGQPSPRRFQNIGFIPDWWTATSPVVDFLLARRDVDMTKLVLLGESFGGTLAPRAASKDPRFSAVIALDGLVSLQQALLAQFPASLNTLYDNSLVEEFDKVVISLTTNVSLPINIRWIFQQGLYAFKTTSPFDWFKRLGEINLTPTIVAGLGSRPVYVAKGEVSVLNMP
jgi:pimeloyl-ACP methyl ester carboxylesterase